MTLLVTLLSLFSGTAALVYEVLWQRGLGLVFGNTVYATSTVLVAVMLGFAAGALVAGRIAPRLRQPLLAFGLVEAGIAVSVLLVPLLFGGVRAIYRILYQQTGTFSGPMTVMRFVLAVAVLLVPAALMGATLPLLAEFYAAESRTFGRRLGLLYGTNTLGAVLGVLACSFLLLPWLGVGLTRLAAAGTNLVVATIAGIWAFRCRATGTTGTRPAVPESATKGYQPDYWLGLGLAAGSGMLALGFEVAWYRALIMVYGSTSYSFGSMLAVFLAGIGIGSLAAGRFLDRQPEAALTLLAGSLAVIGAATLVAMARFDAQPEFLLGFLLRHGFRWPAMVAAKILITAKALFVPALFFGVNFTAAARMVRGATGSSGGAAAAVYTVNTAGAVAGSLLAGFVLLPVMGLEASLLALALGSLVLAVAAALGIRQYGLARTAILAAVAGCLGWKALNPVGWDRHLLAMGAYFSPWNYIEDGRVVLRERAQAEKLQFYHDGLTATVSASKLRDETHYFSINGKVEADTSPRGMLVQRMIGHLPMLFHPEPKEVLNIGLGAGVTLGALGSYPLRRLDTVEIEPAVTAVASLWGRFNQWVLFHPRLRAIWWDGRNYLYCTTNTYDVIASDPFEPVVGGAAQLFTVEHFRTARARLNPGGIMCQWIPTYEMSRQDYACLVKTFVSAFPETVLFFTGLDTILLGFRDGVKVDPRLAQAKFTIPQVRRSLEEVGFTSVDTILGMLVARFRGEPDWARELPLHSDSQPVIEFSTPRHALHYTPDVNQRVLLQLFSPLPEEWRRYYDDEGWQRLEDAHEALRRTLEANVLKAEGRGREAFEKLMSAYRLAPENPVVRNELAAMIFTSAHNLMKAGRLSEAARQFQVLLHYDPGHFWARYHLAHLALLSGNPEFARTLVADGMKRWPRSELLAELWKRLEGERRL